MIIPNRDKEREYIEAIQGCQNCRKTQVNQDSYDIEYCEQCKQKILSLKKINSSIIKNLTGMTYTENKQNPIKITQKQKNTKTKTSIVQNPETKLKTLNEIDMWHDEAPEYKTPTAIVESSKLRQEALRVLTNLNYDEVTHTHYVEEGDIRYPPIAWIKHFFNITEEELNNISQRD